MKRPIQTILSKSMLAFFKVLSRIPIISGFGKHMYAAGLFGRASGMYFRKQYKSAVGAYEIALQNSQGMEEIPPFNISFEQAYLALAEMYKKGLGVEKDEMKAEEYYLKAGSRGDIAYERKMAMKSWYDKNWK